MPIHFQPAEIEAFFGATLDRAIFAKLGREQYWLDYSGRVLKYSLIIDVERDTVMISGDPQTPWGGDSMYEIGVPCTSIFTHPSGYDDGVALAFFYGDPTDRRNRMLTIIKRRDANLVVWPSWPYPAGHPNAYEDTNT